MAPNSQRFSCHCLLNSGIKGIGHLTYLASLKFLILLPSFSKRWGYKAYATKFSLCRMEVKPRASWTLGKHSTNRATYISSPFPICSFYVTMQLRVDLNAGSSCQPLEWGENTPVSLCIASFSLLPFSFLASLLSLFHLSKALYMLSQYFTAALYSDPSK